MKLNSILSLSNQANIFDSPDNDNEADGVLLYLSVRFKKEFRGEADQSMRDLLRKVETMNEEDFNNNAGKRSSPDGKTSPESIGRESREDHHSDHSDDGLAQKSELYTGQNLPMVPNFLIARPELPKMLLFNN